MSFFKVIRAAKIYYQLLQIGDIIKIICVKVIVQ